MNVLLIIIYFGELPPWIDHFIQSCEFNPKVDWLFFTDQPNLPQAPANIKFVKQSLSDFETRVKQKLNITPIIEFPRKLCDFRPTYGIVFDDYISGYDFWGHCDIDVIFGDLSLFLSDETLTSYDVISSRMQMHMSGHFSLYKNNDLLNNAYTKHKGHKKILASSIHVAFDESERKHARPSGITAVLREMALAGEINALWRENMVSYPHRIAKSRMKELGKHPGDLSPDDFWIWTDGKLSYRGDAGSQIAYLHFQNWKNESKFCSQIEPVSKNFKINSSGIQNIGC
jgi:hypothetical protein